MRFLLLLMFSFPAHAALEAWDCWQLATFYGFVAVDRDSGLPIKDRINKTVKAIIVTESRGYEDINATDAQALIHATYYVYATPKITPYEHKRATLARCVGGSKEAPNLGVLL